MAEDFEGLYLEVGAGRSGTNFLGLLLASHPLLAYWRRPKYIWRHGNAWKRDDCLTAEDASPRIKRYIRRRFYEYMVAAGKDRLLVNTQAMAVALDFVYEVFPDIKVVHIIRDGRDVAPSQVEEWRWREHPGSDTIVRRRIKEVPLLDLPAYLPEYLGLKWYQWTGKQRRHTWGPKFKDWKRKLRSMDLLQYCAESWRACVASARAVGLRKPDQYYEVLFEDLIEKPDETVPPLLEYMELPPAEEVDRFIDERIDRSRPRQYQRRMDDEQLARIMPIEEDLLRELGYLQEDGN